jgi:hypothetical protein
LHKIRFVEWTADNRLRHAAFLGLRDELRRTTTSSLPGLLANVPAGAGPILNSVSVSAQEVGAPEPATLGLMALGLLGAGFAGRKRSN